VVVVEEEKVSDNYFNTPKGSTNYTKSNNIPPSFNLPQPWITSPYPLLPLQHVLYCIFFLKHRFLLLFTLVASSLPLCKGTSEFTPTRDDTKAACRSMYRARRTLLIKFENDLIDEVCCLCLSS
jgi:hypothetical protein